ncbi:MAG TPA: uroporphyrinogen decarboxylase family protein [Phycisphaerae bacterium]|nr:uroporphyrinogen decarboxylase family protein [Phycisphaerae bacterium]
MTSRERILAAIDHREPDRVPIDCGAMRSTGIQAIAYNRLKAHLDMQGGHTRVYDVVQQLAEPEDFCLERFGIDAINAGRQFPDTGWRDWTLPDGSACQVPAYLDLRRQNGEWLAHNTEGAVVGKMVQGTTYFSQTCWPFADDDWFGRLAQLPAVMSSIIWAGLPEPMYAEGHSPDNLQRIVAHIRHLRATQDRAIMLAVGANLFEWGTFLRRMDNFLLDLAGDRPKAEALLDRLVESHLAGFDRILPLVGDDVDIIQLGDDLGMENGPFMSPRMYREIFKPRHKILVDHIRKTHPGLKVFLHSCGSIAALLPDIIEAGFDIINPVQISARDMEPSRLKKDFGKDITFWGGGCDTQKILPRGTPRQVRDHVRRNIDVLGPGGGFVFCSVHNILAEVPPENVLAMYEAALG